MRFFVARSRSGGLRHQVFRSVTTLANKGGDRMPRRQPSKDSSLPASSRTTIMAVLDDVRHQLQEAEATAPGPAPSIHESCDFNSDQPNLGYLCEQVAELMNGIAAKFLVASVLQVRSLALAVAIEEQRRRLRRTQAVLCSMTFVLRTTPQPNAPHLLVVFSSLAVTCELA